MPVSVMLALSSGFQSRVRYCLTVEIRYYTDLDTSEIASPVCCTFFLEFDTLCEPWPKLLI